MVIRSYTADSVAAALKQVRSEMGGDAVVLKTRLIDGDGGARQYEVTACLDQPTVAQANVALRSNPTVAAPAAASGRTSRVDLTAMVAPTTESESATADRLAVIEAKLELLLQANQLDQVGMKKNLDAISRAARAMQAADVPEHWIADFCEEIRSGDAPDEADDDVIRRLLVARLERELEPGLDFVPGDRVLVLGPAGAGKTSLVGRLAAHLTFEKGRTVKLVSLDNYKVGALDEIASYADLLGVGEIATADENEPAGPAAAAKDTDKVTLIDTCAFPRDPERLAELKKKIDRLRPTHRLAVFSALTRSSDIETQARQIAALEPTHLVFTMTDLTDHLGSLLAGTWAAEAKIAIVTDSPSGADSCRVPEAETIADALLGREAERE